MVHITGTESAVTSARKQPKLDARLKCYAGYVRIKLTAFSAMPERIVIIATMIVN
jgi:hypothetical protein